MSHVPRSFAYDLARVLLVDDDPTSRLTLKTVLEAGGYSVDSAASAAEAVGKLEEGEYKLVTALVTTYQNSRPESSRNRKSMLIKPEDVPGLLSKVATLISGRATRR